MKDSIIAGTGNSRYLRTSIPADTTWADALAMLRAGTFPIDLAGINAAGFTQVGTALNTANLLKSAVVTALGLDANATPSDAWEAIISLANEKVASVAGKTGIVTLDANDIEFDAEESYDSGTVGAWLDSLVEQIATDMASVRGDVKRTVGYLIENLYPASLYNNGSAIAKSGCTAAISGESFVFTSTVNGELYFGTVASTGGTTYADSMGPKIPCTAGQAVNISLAPAFIKNYVSFFNASNKSISWQKIITNSFTVAPPEGAVYLVIRVGVPTVTSGAVYSTDIVVTNSDYSKPVIEITANKDSQYALFNDDLFDGLGFVVGGLNNSGEISGEKYRVATSPMLYFDTPLIVTVPAQMASGYDTFDPDTKVRDEWSGWFFTGTYTIPAKTYFRIQCRREPQDSTEVITNPKTFLSQYKFVLASNITNLEERVAALEDGLPSYYYENDWLEDKINEVHDACGFLNGVVFPFITDLHFTANSLNSKYLLKDVLDMTSCSMVIAGGDYAAMYGTQADLDGEYQTLLDYAGYIGHENWFAMNGNHDLFNAVSTTDSTRHSYTWGKTYNGIFRNSERWQIKSSVSNGYYCVDNEAQKTRMIVLNSCEPTNAVSDFVVVGAARVKNAQLQWLYDRIAELSGYKIIVFSHIASDSTMGSYTSAMAPVQTILEAFANKTTFTARGSGASADVTGTFAGTTNTLICHISGHSHKDESHVSNGVLSISTTCDAHYQDDGHGAVVGTVTEQAFDVYCVDYDAMSIQTIRFGRGSNRSFDCDSASANFGEIT